jgi:mRNA deadenylase 3'-5' endonuclease subunit Ccr4
MPFSFATYNILADSYIRPEWYPHTPAEWLTPTRRHSALVAAIVELGSDMIALQEVELPVFEMLETHLKPLGYTGRYEAKGRNKPDGCATFVNQEVVTGIKWQRLDYQDAMEGGAVSGHLALITLLEMNGRSLGVANTHVKWAPPETPRTAHQGARQLDELVDFCMAQSCDAWIVCGDLNCVPDSTVLDSLREAGFIDSHDANHAPTCNANRAPRKLDHIFVTQALHSVPGAIETIDADTPLPSSVHPSDHLPVTAILDWR